MKLIHTLLFMIRENHLDEDLALADQCLRSLEKGSYKTVVIYNQGFWKREILEGFLKAYDLNCIVIGDGFNTGTVIGRQGCFNYIFKQYPDTQFVSEIHLDMILTTHWEDPLVTYLEENDEPLVSCGIVDQGGNLSFLQKLVEPLPKDKDLIDDYLSGLKQDSVVHGFTNPCIHKVEVLKATGGYNQRFLTGKQAFEDDSMLLGYYYYYGTRVNWKPKVNYNSVVYHAVAGQRLGMGDSVMVNYSGLVKQYGAMGLKHLSELHKSQWQVSFFSEQYLR